MDSSAGSNRQAGPKFWPTTGLIAVVILIGAALATSLSLAWPALWGLFVFLQAVLLAPFLYALLARSCARDPSAASTQSQAQPTGLMDPVTRTLNRRGITSSLIEAMAQSQRYNTPVSLISLSIDDIAAVTARLGAAAESDALETASAALEEVLRLPDRLGRYNDHEFLVVLPQTHGEQAAMVAERLRVALSSAVVTTQGEEVSLTLSAGVAEFGRGQDLERFLANAHDALREARSEGGNRVCAFKALRAKGL